jgi:hypothetical protein
MKIKHFIFGLTLISSFSGYGQILENSIVNHGNLIVTEQKEGQVKLNFAEGNMTSPYCLIPFNYKNGGIILPKDRNGNTAPASCSYVPDTNKQLTFDPQAQFENRKYDGVFLFNKTEMPVFLSCFDNLDIGMGYGQTQNCIDKLKNIHSIALRKKRKLNVSSEELYFSHVDHSARHMRKEVISPYAPSNVGFQFGFGTAIGY